MKSIHRRSFFVAAAWGLSLGSAARLEGAGGPEEEKSARADAALAIHPEFPSQDPALVQETVAVSHGNFKRVQELVEAHPALAKATWDWGFGDWESALGAASHTGNRDIAEFLISKGARPTLFSAAMLGQLSVVRGFVESSPGVQRIPGPHGITLLAHAKFGGEPAAEVRRYLEELGDADPVPQQAPLSEEEMQRYIGRYAFGTGPEDWLEVFERRGGLMVKRGERTPRGLVHLGDHAFHPAGAEAVRIRFGVENGQAVQLTVHDPDVVLKGSR